MAHLHGRGRLPALARRRARAVLRDPALQADGRSHRARGDGLEVGAAQPVAAGLNLRRDDMPPFDVAADGQHLVVVLADEAERAAPVTVLVGWAGTLTP